MSVKLFAINKNNKHIKEVSVASLVLGVCHIVYTFFFEHTIEAPTPIQGKATIVFKDSITGKMDTMDLETYIKQQEKK